MLFRSDLDDAQDLHALGATHHVAHDGRAREQRLMSRLPQHAHMNEDVARTIGRRQETVTLDRVKPFDHAARQRRRHGFPRRFYRVQHTRPRLLTVYFILRENCPVFIERSGLFFVNGADTLERPVKADSEVGGAFPQHVEMFLHPTVIVTFVR